MAQHGYEGASIAKISEESDLPASSIYWHFGSKEGVLAAVMERGATSFFERVDVALPTGLRGVERIREVCDRASAALALDADFIRLFILLLLTGRANLTVRRVRAEGKQRLRAVLQDSYPNLRPAAARRLADVAIAMFDGAFLAVQNDPSLEYAPLLRQMAQALAALAKAASAPGRRART